MTAMTMRPRRTARFALALTIAAAVVAVPALPAHAAGSAARPAAKSVAVTSLPAQQAVLQGTKVVLTLETNRTTGYTWTTKVAGDPGTVKVGKGKYKAPASDAMGAAGTTTWTIDTKKPGTATVEVLTTPPGGGAAESLGVLTVTVGKKKG